MTRDCILLTESKVIIQPQSRSLLPSPLLLTYINKN